MIFTALAFTLCYCPYYSLYLEKVILSFKKMTTTLSLRIISGWWDSTLQSKQTFPVSGRRKWPAPDLGLMLRSRAYYASRIRYCAKSHSTFHQMRLYTSGNIDAYLGPDVCSMCNRRVARNHRAVNGDNCNIWCHIKCASIKPSEYKSFQCLSSFFWWCPRCQSSSLPFASE